MTDSQIFNIISEELTLKPNQIKIVAKFLDEGATVPFLARYRQEATGGLDEEQIRAVRDALEFRRTLEDRREFILKTITDQDKLTPELEKDIKEASEIKTLEDLYLPYKPKRKTRASVAREKGLEPLAQLMWDQELFDGAPEENAKKYIDEDKGVENTEDAFQGAKDIIAEWINENIEVRDRLRNDFRKFGLITSKKSMSVENRTVYESYYDFKCPVKYLKPYQILALNRGEREGVLMVNLEIDEEKTIDNIDWIVMKEEDTIFTDYLYEAIDDAYKRLLFPALERELRNELTDQADEHAIQTFARNLGNLLMQPPLASKTVMGIDPGFRTGCKVAVVDQFGKYLDGNTIYPVPPHNRVDESEKIIDTLINKHGVTLIAIGNGTASRETEQFVANYIQKRKDLLNEDDLSYIIVNEAGASVYSASTLAREEFPDLDAAQRGNISIARRVQDPLAELVKIDPKSIGVGLYQHDVNQVRLLQSLDDVVESCVNTVGVNLNTASSALLTHISGLTKSVAEKIVKYREEQGPFKSRNELMDVPGMGPFRFEQAAGFLRIPESDNPLDNTAIHPESYDAAKKLCEQFDIEIDKLSELLDELPVKFKNVNTEELAGKFDIGVPTLELILENLMKPGRDPRESLPKPILRKDLLKIDDLAPGLIMEGTVRNVVDFGAFVDIGVKEDGLLHISKMGKEGQRVEDPHEHVSVGDIIKVKIESVDKERGRIGLAMAD
jgi:uncharacterized protein